MNGEFCSHCGQKAALPLDGKRIFGDIWSHFLDLDFALVRTFRDLSLRPHTLIQSYIEGRRKFYTNPFKCLFISATLYFLAISYFDVKVDFLSKDNANEEHARYVAALMSYLVFLFLIPTAQCYKWLFGNHRMSYAAAYVSVSYIWSLYLLMGGLLAPLSVSFTSNYGLVRTVVGFIIVLITIKNLHQLSWYRSSIFSILFLFAYFLSTALIMTALISISYLIGFQPLMFKIN